MVPNNNILPRASKSHYYRLIEDINIINLTFSQESQDTFNFHEGQSKTEPSKETKQLVFLGEQQPNLSGE